MARNRIWHGGLKSSQIRVDLDMILDAEVLRMVPITCYGTLERRLKKMKSVLEI